MRRAIIWRQDCTNAVHSVMMPKQNVMNANQILGPNVLTAMVDGSWNAILAMVKIKMDTEYRLPTSSSKSLSMDVTEADEMTPLSSRFKLQRMPAMVQRRRSTFNLMLSAHSASIPSLSGGMIAWCSSCWTSWMDSSTEVWLGEVFMLVAAGDVRKEAREEVQGQSYWMSHTPVEMARTAYHERRENVIQIHVRLRGSAFAVADLRLPRDKSFSRRITVTYIALTKPTPLTIPPCESTSCTSSLYSFQTTTHETMDT